MIQPRNINHDPFATARRTSDRTARQLRNRAADVRAAGGNPVTLSAVQQRAQRGGSVWTFGRGV